MTRFGWLVVSGIAVAVLGIALLLWGFARQSGIPGLREEDGGTPTVDPTTLSIYANGEYGFTLLYPASAQIEDSLTGGVTFPWRANAAATGTPIVRISTPSGEVRIGVSSDARERTSCEEASPSEEALGATLVGSTTWQTFAFDALGTDDERRVTSYRKVHEDRCFSIEAFAPLAGAPTGSAPTESPDFIIRNFTFAR